MIAARSPATSLPALVAAALLLASPATAQGSDAVAVPATGDPVAGMPDDTPAADTAKAPRHAPGDPLEGLNRRFFAINQGLDRAILRPLARGYATVVPKPVRAGIRHFFSNLTEPVVFLNDLLQLKPKRAARTLARFAINTTLGIGGIIDVATPEKLPHRANGFGNTLGHYGVKTGPYLFLPLFGPSDLRDLGGGTADGFVLPTVVGSPFDRTDYRIVSTVLTGLDARAEADADLKALLDSALDPYATVRSVFLQSRAASVAALRGDGGDKGSAGSDGALDDPLTDPDAATAVPGITSGEMTPSAVTSGEATGPAFTPVPAAMPSPTEAVSLVPGGGGNAPRMFTSFPDE